MCSSEKGQWVPGMEQESYFQWRWGSSNASVEGTGKAASVCTRLITPVQGRCSEMEELIYERRQKFWYV